MMPTEMAVIVFVCVFGGALLGMFLRLLIPEPHLTEDSKDVIKLGMGLIATMAALVLGLVITTAKGSYDTQDEAVKHSAAKIMLLDRVLANYGPETKETRELLRRTVAERVGAIWPQDGSQPVKFDAPETVLAGQEMAAGILRLSPRNDAQRLLHYQAVKLGREIAETRWFVLGSLESSVPLPFLAVVVFWVAVIFTSFGIFAPRNATVVAVLFVCSLSVAASIFLILEMDQPYEGLIKISGAPLHYTLSHLGQ